MSIIINIILCLLLILLVSSMISKYVVYANNNDGARYKHVKLNFIDIYKIMLKLSTVSLSITGNYHIYTDKNEQYKSDFNCTCLFINDNEIFLEYKRVNDRGDISYNEGYCIHTGLISYLIIMGIHNYNIYRLKLRKIKFINKRELPEI